MAEDKRLEQPLSAAEIICRLKKQTPSASEHLTITCDEASAIISMLQPPTDAAGRVTDGECCDSKCLWVANEPTEWCCLFDEPIPGYADRAECGTWFLRCPACLAIDALTPPTDAVKCEVCDGSGELQDAQAWDCGQDNSPCPYYRTTDAAVLEAVEVFEALPHRLHAIGPAYFAALHRAKATLLSHVRAVQAQLLTDAQVAALHIAQLRCLEEGNLADVVDILESTFPAAFPELGEG